MGIRQQQSYVDLKKQLDESRQLQTNLLIITLPGTGLKRFFQEYVADTGNNAVQLLSPSNNNLSAYNLIHWDWDQADTFANITKLFQAATSEQHFAVTVNYPGLLSSLEIKNSYFLNHIYRTAFFGARSAKDLSMLLSEMGSSIDQTEIDRIYQQSGGIAQLAKLLVVKADDDQIQTVSTPISTAIKNCPIEILQQLGVVADGQLRIGLLANTGISTTHLNITTSFDLSFTENGQTSVFSLTSSEKNILDFLTSHDGQITKEQIADIKWGTGKYDKFSDQAIKQQILRLGRKLTQFELTAIPGVGYQLKSVIK